MPMRVCILLGTGRPRGNTAEMVKHFREELERQNVLVDVIPLWDKEIAPCAGCYHCQNVAGEYGCAIQDDMQAIVATLLEADVLVFAAPIYIWQAPARLKAVMDRMYAFNKFYGPIPRQRLNAHQSYTLLTTCGYDPAYGADLLEEAIRRWCKHSDDLPFLGAFSWRDEDDLASFQTEEAKAAARAFAREIAEKWEARHEH